MPCSRPADVKRARAGGINVGCLSRRFFGRSTRTQGCSDKLLCRCLKKARPIQCDFCQARHPVSNRRFDFRSPIPRAAEHTPRRIFHDFEIAYFPFRADCSFVRDRHRYARRSGHGHREFGRHRAGASDGPFDGLFRLCHERLFLRAAVHRRSAQHPHQSSQAAADLRLFRGGL